MYVSGFGLLERVGFKPNSKCEVKLSLIDGQDQAGKTNYVRVVLNANMDKCKGLFEIEKRLKEIQSLNPDAKLLCEVQARGVLSSARVSKCQNYVNFYGLLVSISEKKLKNNL
ncbi:MAG: hypothetical protein CMB99_02895 [Flavobacteriaceae bacterium]|nr:hypothetical protein [Flavobacteriaceae bacterium]|tara:strand:+ start:3502 stop:3840 length:339 start_codon:yes stop_codon:yes gene_type:complete